MHGALNRLRHASTASRLDLGDESGSCFHEPVDGIHCPFHLLHRPRLHDNTLPWDIHPQLRARLLLEHAGVAPLVPDDPSDYGSWQMSHGAISPALL